MAPRLELQQIFESILGQSNVYFQPPNNVQMQYPCIVYERDFADTKFADDEPYSYTQRYQVIVVARDPDSPIPLQIANLPMCRYERFYTADNLNHDVFTLFF
jgi:hypothetical protein